MIDKTIKVETGTRKTTTSNKRTHYPFIRLKGLWLEEAGIRYGEKVHITIENDKLVINPSHK
jgi:hypothetical protein